MENIVRTNELHKHFGPIRAALLIALGALTMRREVD